MFKIQSASVSNLLVVGRFNASVYLSKALVQF